MVIHASEPVEYAVRTQTSSGGPSLFVLARADGAQREAHIPIRRGSVRDRPVVCDNTLSVSSQRTSTIAVS
jgi:hypothetical protein